MTLTDERLDQMRRLVEKAREATELLRDSARTGKALGFRERDPLVMAIHNALDCVPDALADLTQQAEEIKRLKETVQVLETLVLHADDAATCDALARSAAEEALLRSGK